MAIKSRILCALAVIISLSTSFVTGLTSISVGAASTIVVAVEAFTVGGGFITYPTEVVINTGDTGASVIERVLGGDKINKGNGINGGEITSIAMEDTDFCMVESDIAMYLEDREIEISDEVETEGWIANNDFVQGSSWTFLLNNRKASTPLSNYAPQNGDVVRISFSLYEGGADLGIDSTIFSSTNRDTLYKHFAQLDEASYSLLEDVAIDLTMSQNDINEAVESAREVTGTVSAPTTLAPAPSAPSGAITTRPPVRVPEDRVVIDKVGTAPTGINHAVTITIVLVSAVALTLSLKRK
ncbi:MAG: hypothetical protein FWH05_08390 [Oscillospiraceae bacterium]|nr:hypothetical protein [Oscillospiraceae bacterium]